MCHFAKARVVIFRGQFLSIVSGIPCQLNVTNGETEVGTNGSMYLQFTVKKSYKAWNKEISVSKLSLNFVEGRRQYGGLQVMDRNLFWCCFLSSVPKRKEKKSKRWDWNDIKRGNLPAIFGKRKRKIWVISDRFYVLRKFCEWKLIREQINFCIVGKIMIRMVTSLLVMRMF